MLPPAMKGLLVASTVVVLAPWNVIDKGFGVGVMYKEKISIIITHRLSAYFFIILKIISLFPWSLRVASIYSSSSAMEGHRQRLSVLAKCTVS